MLFALDSDLPDLPVARCHFCLSLLCLPYLLSCQTQFAFIECKYLLKICNLIYSQSVSHSFSQAVNAVGSLRSVSDMGSVLALGLLAILFGSKWNYLVFIIIICSTGNGKRKSGQRLTGSMALIRFLISLKHHWCRIAPGMWTSLYSIYVHASVFMGFVMQSCVEFLLQFIELKFVNRGREGEIMTTS